MSHTPAPVLGDAARLRQVLWNLVSNASKLTPSGGRVRVSVETREGRCELVVADTGVGITPEFLPTMFERFRQANGQASRRHGGLGLGLSLVRSLVEMHGGHVQADSPGANAGARFTVVLPLATGGEFALPEPAAADARLSQPGQGEAPLSGLHVLVVDDEPDGRELVGRVLEDHGARVTLVGSAGEAMTVAAGEQLDLVVSDIGMPDVDGYELMRRLRARGITTPAIALTAFVRAEDAAQALRAGYQRHLRKPLDVGDLVSAVVRLSGRASMMPGPSAVQS